MRGNWALPVPEPKREPQYASRPFVELDLRESAMYGDVLHYRYVDVAGGLPRLIPGDAHDGAFPNGCDLYGCPRWRCPDCKGTGKTGHFSCWCVNLGSSPSRFSGLFGRGI